MVSTTLAFLHVNLPIFVSLPTLPLNRINMDKCKNKLGNLLLHSCKGNSIFIVNGRVGNDTNIGRFTCRNANVVDYNITSPELLKLLFDFDILESSVLL